ncbi:S8 family peptidase [Paeniglutamicibacter gangotriensis]|uniref:S8 family peptidase n=1 Tax=Paeniglutamicibacter gangotriensis TaxID=254787 RepID=A0A5B0EEG4_9MICC|nr:S8 family peptidase [Paeniglutamicibacter gangotriensis]KAA0976231.1 S8 family peptidase [Paeniglutamicibacter gangotriensis]
MTTSSAKPPVERPILLGAVSSSRSFRVYGGGKAKVAFNNSSSRIDRLDTKLEETFRDFKRDVELATSIQAADPQLVLVFEALDENIDLSRIATRLGFEILSESEGSMDPTEEFTLISKAPKDPQISTCLHAICLNEKTLAELLKLWRTWKRQRPLPFGYAKLAELFSHLKDIRPWGPEDRMKTIDWQEYFAGRLPDQTHTLEIELWYRESQILRRKAQSEVEQLIGEAGGELLSSATIPAVGYHGVKCRVPETLVKQLALEEFSQVQVVKSANVMYLRLSGQSIPLSSPGTESADSSDLLPTGNPVVCLLDGVPVSNHKLLSGRLVIHDPDDLSADSRSTVEDRKHGTWMASAVIWGDRSLQNEALDRPILIRPILTPSPETQDRTEEIGANELTPDLMERVFRELFDGVDGQDPIAPDVAIVNLSVGDPTTPFDSHLSSWARSLDWLSFKYGVLVVISAGNYASLKVAPHDSDSIQQLVGEERRAAIQSSIHMDQANRRLLSPAEAINALTVGALHEDASGSKPIGYRFDPSDGLANVSPITALGGGHRRSVKPEVAAPGGKIHYSAPVVTTDTLRAANATSTGPGIKVASSIAGTESYTVGTSPAAALVTRSAAQLYDMVDAITGNRVLSRHERAVAIKALLAHGARHPDTIVSDSLDLQKALGFGRIERDYSLGCSSNEAVMLYFGELGAAEEQDLLLPLPDGLNVRETKRITATLAWLSPVNWKNRQYRQA